MTTTRCTAIHRIISKIVRARLGVSGTSYPIIEQDGFAPPALNGETSHWRTKGGSRIWHPNAYARKGRSNMVYSPSSRHITVGIGWLCQQLADYWYQHEVTRKEQKEMRRKRREDWRKLLGQRHPTTVRFDSEGKIVNGDNTN